MGVSFEHSFERANAKLSLQERGLVLDFVFKLMNDPSHPGLSLERVDKKGFKGFWSGRVNEGLRAIFHKGKGVHTLVWVDKHDAAYAWAEKRRIEENPRTGELQIVKSPEVKEASPLPAVKKEAVAGLFDDSSDAYLLSLGVPADWLPTIRRLRTKEQLADVSRSLPEELAERLFYVSEGEIVTPPPPLPAGPAALETPEARRRYFVIHDASEIDDLRDRPIELWLRYLHPSQRSLVEAGFNGPAKVTGAAGTGKTVVAMHRARHLARQGKRVLLTSFVTTLCRNLDRSLGLLCSGEERSRIDVRTVHAAATLIHKEAGTGHGFPRDADLEKAIEGFAPYAAAVGDATFLVNEWQQVVDAQAIRTWDEYREADRRGRGKALGVAERKTVWDCFSRVLSQLEAAGQVPPSVWLREAEELVRSGKATRRWDAVVVDEVQDLAPAALRFLAALAEPDPASFLLVGDAGQRIYRSGASLRSLGIDVRGRSKVLRLNYRNTRQIQRASDLLLRGGTDDLDGGVDERKGTLSPLGGPDPVFRGFGDRQGMYDFFVAEVKGLVARGIAPKEIGVFARSNALCGAASEALKAAGIAAEALDAETDLSSVTGVNVGTMHRAKGLEFKAVFVLGAEEGILPPASLLARKKDPADREALLTLERNLLYVALTRARDEAWVLWSGTPCPFVAPFEETGTGADPLFKAERES